MGDQVVALPLNRVALLHLDVHRIKLKMPDRNLSDGRCNVRCNGFSWHVVIACAARTPRANEECATDDDREPTDAEKPKSQHSVTRTRLALFSLN